MSGTPASRGQSFIARDHRYVYLGGSIIALVGLSLWSVSYTHLTLPTILRV